jgi:hypothetical protein
MVALPSFENLEGLVKSSVAENLPEIKKLSSGSKFSQLSQPLFSKRKRLAHLPNTGR